MCVHDWTVSVLCPQALTETVRDTSTITSVLCFSACTCVSQGEAVRQARHVSEHSRAGWVGMVVVAVGQW